MDEPRFVPAAVVDGEFFGTIAGAPIAGRTFGAGDPPGVVVVSARLARQTAASASAVVGRVVSVAGAAAVVTGVMPDGFAFPVEQTDVWISARLAVPIAFDESGDARRFDLVGGMRAGVSLPVLREQARSIRAALEPDAEAADGGFVGSVRDEVVGSARPALIAFAAAGLIVLVIASANVATLLLARTMARRHELAVRFSLGARRGQLFASVLAESLVVAAAGSLLGLAFAFSGIRIAAAWAQGVLPRLGVVRLDGTVLAGCLAFAAASSVLAALPALRLLDITTIAVRPGFGGTRRTTRIRAALAACQIGLAVVLLNAGLMLTRTVLVLLRGDTGLDARGTIVSQLMATESMSFQAAGRQQWLGEALQRVRAIPGVVAAGAGTSLPPNNQLIEFRITLRDVGERRVLEGTLASVTPGYLQAIGVRLLQGRHFEEADAQRGDLLAVISEGARRMLFPDGHAVGAPLPASLPAVRRGSRATVIGIVSDVKYGGLEFKPGPAIYVLWKELPAGQLYLAVKSAADPKALILVLRATLRQVDAHMPLMPIRGMQEVFHRSEGEREFRALVGASIALLSLAIALVGVAGTLGRIVSERRPELAIRVALGATAAGIMRHVFAGGAMICAFGVVAGAIGTILIGGVLRTLLVGVSPGDPLGLAAVALVVFAGGAAASYLPARRAATANPLEIFRRV